MIDSVFSIVIEISKLFLFASMVVVCARIIRGPHAGDRIVALDMLCLIGVGIATLAAVSSGSMAFIDVVLGIALIGFLATVAFAGFIAKGTETSEGDK